MSRTAVSVVFVTRDRRADLLRSLAALKALTPPPAQILVVDNASTDDTIERLREHHPEVEILPQDHNLGVAASRNLGIEAAAHEIVLFLDDDALLATPDALDHIGRRFETSPDTALIAFRIVNQSRGETLSHEFPRRRLSRRQVMRPQEVAYFIGCGFAVRRSVFLASGGFDPLIHYGLEELDLSYRLLEARHRLFYEPAIAVHHLADPEGRRGDAWHFHLMHSRVLVALRNLPLWIAVPHLAIWHAGMLGYGLLHGHAGAAMRGAASGWRLAPAAWRSRKPISRATARRILALSGRLFS